MDFELSADQRALQEAAGALLERHCTTEALRAWVGDGVVVGTLAGSGAADPGSAVIKSADPGPADPTGDAPRGFDPQLWSAMAEQGWLGVELAETDGGLGLGAVETAVLCEQLGRYLAPAPYLQTVLALGALAPSAGSDPTVAGWVRGICAGELVGTVAWSTVPGAVKVTVDAQEGGGRGQMATLSGTPDPVVYGPSADVVVVVTEDGPFAVGLSNSNPDPNPDPGSHQHPNGPSRPRPEPAMDRTREIGWLHLDAAPARRLGDADDAQRLADRAAVALSAELLGIAERVLEISVEYARDRVQFGRPIGSFQAVKHRLADALVDVEGMRSTAYYGAWCVAAGNPEAAVAASMAKAWCSDAARRVLATGLQVHGGIGFTWEHVLHLYLKRSQLDEVSFGDASWHRDRLAGLIRQRLAAGRELF